MLSCTEEEKQGWTPTIIKGTEANISQVNMDKELICLTDGDIQQIKDPLEKLNINADVKPFQNIKSDVYEKYCELKSKQLALREKFHKTLNSSHDLQSNITKAALPINIKQETDSKSEKCLIEPDSDPKLCLPYSVFIGKKVNAPSSELLNSVRPMTLKQERNISKRIRRQLIKSNLISNYNSDSSDDEIQKLHPNRRLQTERPENLITKPSEFCRLGTISSNYFKNSKVGKSSEELLNLPKSEVVQPSQNTEDSKTQTVVFSGLQLEKKEKLRSYVKLIKTLNHSGTNKTRQLDNLETNGSKTTVFNRLGVRKRKRKNTHSKSARKASKMWVDVINTPDLWKTEDYWIRCSTDRSESEEEYDDMLEDFVTDGLKDKLLEEDETLNEKRFKEKLQDPDFLHLIEEFYISPAKVEVLYQKLTDDESAEENLNQVCLAQGWSQPKYTQISQPNNTYGFLFSCDLKCKSFIPTKLASNCQLAKDLAASLCLDWLGITPRKEPYGFTEQTYFK